MCHILEFIVVTQRNGPQNVGMNLYYFAKILLQSQYFGSKLEAERCSPPGVTDTVKIQIFWYKLVLIEC